MRCRRRRRG